MSNHLQGRSFNLIKGLNHIGIVVRDIDETMGLFSRIFGAVEIGRKTFAELGQTSALISIGDFKIELMAPYGDKGVVPDFIRKRGEGLHHISVLTDDIDAEDEHLAENGVNVIGKAPKGINDDRVMFTHPKQTNGIVFEIVEPKK
jgi:methylmalonyl-CoA/ethylmalonyl-CoA epimerase